MRRVLTVSSSPLLRVIYSRWLTVGSLADISPVSESPALVSALTKALCCEHATISKDPELMPGLRYQSRGPTLHHRRGSPWRPIHPYQRP